MACIPRRLIHLWGFKHDFDTLPATVAALRTKNLEFLLSSNAGWSFLLLGPAEVQSLIPTTFQAADAELLTKAFSVSNSPWIQRVDMARFVVIYAMGGLYLDLDVEVTASLDKLLSSSLILTRGNSQNHVELDIIGAKAGDLRVLALLRTQIVVVCVANAYLKQV